MEKEALSLDSSLYKVMSHPTRLTILNLLKKGEISFENLNKRLRVRKANLSQHLAILRQHKLVSVRRKGQYAYYRSVNNGLVSSQPPRISSWSVGTLKDIGWILALVMLIASPIAVFSSRAHPADQSIQSQLREFLPYEHLGHGHTLTAVISLVFWIALVYMLTSLIKGLWKVGR
ncbi:MAG: hypothetical protein A2Z24_00570 [Candidatus Woykebacteria bacterium RBG_16_44_10]|uniref:HTH arsR-type domain-containing protein n=1 Tax=Candidatus Woykebacteria bacterium RBG_16_44_10 TaxID=1802597 RepID=A0A1G1WD73_9BACT|nr:MAG: hypothetical protein A2Z24_00570 [Candidatus Woykebacteria bacterium RBG_16_44_10]